MAKPEDMTETSAIEPARRVLIDKFWEHRRAYNRAWALELTALHRMVGDPAHAEEYERMALNAADECSEANKQSDLVQTEMSIRFPQVTLERPDAGAWQPILTMLGLLGKRQPEPTP